VIGSGRAVKKKEGTEGTGDDGVGLGVGMGGREKKKVMTIPRLIRSRFLCLFVSFFNDIQKNPVDVYISESHAVLVNPHVS